MITARKRFINIMLLIALLILGGTSILAYFQAQQLIDANALITHTHQVIETADQAMLAITDAESRASLFVLSKDKQYLRDISVLVKTAQENIALMKQLTHDNSFQQNNIKKLEPLVKNKFDLMYQIIRDNYTNTAPFISIATAKQRSVLKDQITSILTTIINHELTLLQQRNALFLHHAKTSNSALIFVGILSEILFIISVILLNYQLYQKETVERELRIIQERYHLAIKGSNTGLWDWKVGSKHVYYSSNFKKLLGYKKDEFPHLFSTFENALHPDDHDRVMALVEKHLADGITYIAEYRLKNKNGEYRWYRAVGEAKKDGHGQNYRMSGSLIDITDRKKVEQMKNEFISIVSHELRTPLTSIHGAISLITSSEIATLSEEANQLLTIAKTNTERLIRLINDILDIEKIESGKMEFNLKTFDLNNLLQEVIAFNQSYADKFSVKIVLAKQIHQVFVKVDHDRFIQVLTNLLSNAIKFSPKNESVIVDVSVINNSIARVSVSDKGEGIPEKFHDKIFQKFSQADSSSTRKHEGTGLGLSITKSIIEKFGGAINFLTKLHHGTTFYFELPIVDTTSTKETYDKSTSTINILHAEDDEDLASIVKSILMNQANIINVSSLKEAKFELAHQDYDLVILDLKLTDGDSSELLPLLHQKNIPVIVFSAYDPPSEYLSYAHSILTKSKTTNEELLEAIKKIIGYKMKKGDNYVNKITQ